MRRSDLRQKAIRRIKRFTLTEEEIDDLIHAGEYRNDPDCEDGEAYTLIKSMIELLPESKRHDLMCLMYLGRNLDYYGLNEEVVDDFCAYADEKNKNIWKHRSPIPRRESSVCPVAQACEKEHSA